MQDFFLHDTVSPLSGEGGGVHPTEEEYSAPSAIPLCQELMLQLPDPILASLKGLNNFRPIQYRIGLCESVEVRLNK